MTERKTILVVDDDEAIREFIEWALGYRGFNVVCAADGAAALAMLEVLRPDLILLDLLMPVMDGETFVKAYKGLRDQSAPIVIITAAGPSRYITADIVRAERLDKPFDLEDLVRVVETVLPQAIGPASKTTF
jgi:DNA-binding response OmpR family regulator